MELPGHWKERKTRATVGGCAVVRRQELTLDFDDLQIEVSRPLDDKAGNWSVAILDKTDPEFRVVLDNVYRQHDLVTVCSIAGVLAENWFREMLQALTKAKGST